MIINTSFRNGTNSNPLQKIIIKECKNLNTKCHSINRIQVSLYKEKKMAKYNTGICCHISIDAKNKHHFDVYEKDSYILCAFISALEKVESLLTSDVEKSVNIYATSKILENLK